MTILLSPYLLFLHIERMNEMKLEVLQLLLCCFAKMLGWAVLAVLAGAGTCLAYYYSTTAIILINDGNKNTNK